MIAPVVGEPSDVRHCQRLVPDLGVRRDVARYLVAVVARIRAHVDFVVADAAGLVDPIPEALGAGGDGDAEQP